MQPSAAFSMWIHGRPLVLWTDGLLFLLLVSVALFVIYARRHQHIRAPWRHVVTSRTGMASGVVLLAYVVIAVLDSLHFHPRLEGHGYSPAVLSVFDVLVSPLREHEERTYSAPFALTLFTKEMVRTADGRERREYPRLKYGGAGLKSVDQRDGDIMRTSLDATTQAILAWSILVLSMAAWRGRGGRRPFRVVVRETLRGGSEIPWHYAAWAALLIIELIFLGADLGVKYHIFGTDKVGQDVFYQALKSIRTGLLIGTLTTLVMLPFAILLGVMAGYFRGLVDDVIQYVYTVLNSIPGVLLIAAAVLMLQVYMSNHADTFTSVVQRSDLRLLFLCLILGVTSWTGLCRLLRGEALKLREHDYVQAARALGVGHFNIIGRHIVPNVMHIVMISVVLDFSGLVLAEAVLSYIGIGVDPSMESWGNMINSARLELARDPVVWWSLAAAFIFMFALVLAANLFADVVRDAFDPRMRINR